MNPLIFLDIAGRIADRLVQAPSVPVHPADAGVVQQQAARVLQREIAPVIEHLTNNEPFYRSRVSWGALFAILGGVATIGTAAANGGATPEVYTTADMSILGGITTLWGRWKARKPIGL